MKTKFFLIILGMSIYVISWSQTRQIEGVVIDKETNISIIGASIIQKGTYNGSTSDLDGNFKFDLLDNQGQVIIVSYIGYVRREIDVSSRNSVDVILELDNTLVDEVVIVGYGSQIKKDVTGSVGSVNSKDFENQPIPRMENMLQGRINGVDVTQNSGAPGAAISIRIRGTSSYAASSSPLYVIDGLIGGDINTINPNDIESLTVLKDASANAIYGAFAANGVVVITTKRGKNGKPKFDVNFTTSLSHISRKLDLMNAPDYMIAVKEKQIITDAGIDPNNPNDPKLIFTENDIREAMVNGNSTDWQNEIFQMARSNNIQLSLSGGSDTDNYYLSAGYNKAEGIVVNTDYERANIRFKYSKNLTDKLTVGLNINNDFERIHNADRSSGGNTKIIKTVLGYAPTEPVYLEDDTYSLRTPGYGYITMNNPVWKAQEANAYQRNNNLQGIISLKYKISESLTFETKAIGRLFTVFNSNVKVPSPDQLAQGNTILSDGTVLTPAVYNSTAITNSSRTFFQNTNQLSYKKVFDRHSIDAFVAYEFFLWDQSSFSQSSSNYEKTSLGLYAANVTSKENESNGAGYLNESWISYLGRANYAFDNKFLFTFTLRRDGSSRLVEGNKWSNFWSSSVGYRLSEDLLSDVSWIEDMKIRFGYGQSGNRAVSIYETQQTLNSSQYTFVNTGGSSAYYYQVKNSQVGWETVNTLNAGLDWSLFNGRAVITADAYYKKSVDLIFPVRTPAYFGGGSNAQNVGEIENKGVEIGLDVTSVDNENDLYMNHTLNFSINRNKLLATDQRDSLSSGMNDPQTFGNTHWSIIGQELGLYKGLVWEGDIWEEGDDIPAYASPGDLKFRDTNEDGVLNEFDAETIGSSRPDFSWGFITDIIYKNLSLNLVFQSVVGRDVYNFGRYNLIGGGGGILNGTHTDVINRWTPEKTDTDIAGFTKTSTYIKNSTYFIEDASFIKCRNITLSYNLPPAFNEHLHITRFKVYAGVQNAFVITNYSGYDPESFNSAGDKGAGVDEGSYPTPRTYTLGVNIVF